VERLETWAGPGQNVSFSESLAELRKKFDEFGRVQARHTKMIGNLADDVATLKTDMVEVKAILETDVAGLKTDVATLKSDMVEVKGTLGEILDRLPPRRE